MDVHIGVAFFIICHVKQMKVALDVRTRIMKELNSRGKIQRHMAADGFLLWSTAVTSLPQGHSVSFLRQN